MAACLVFYGASNDKHRNLMPTYLLQWEAMRYGKAHGATLYDMWAFLMLMKTSLKNSLCCVRTAYGAFIASNVALVVK